MGNDASWVPCGGRLIVPGEQLFPSREQPCPTKHVPHELGAPSPLSPLSQLLWDAQPGPPFFPHTVTDHFSVQILSLLPQLSCILRRLRKRLIFSCALLQQVMSQGQGGMMSKESFVRMHMQATRGGENGFTCMTLLASGFFARIPPGIDANYPQLPGSHATAEAACRARGEYIYDNYPEYVRTFTAEQVAAPAAAAAPGEGGRVSR